MINRKCSRRKTTTLRPLNEEGPDIVPKADRAIGEIAAWFEARGDRMYGEEVSEREHALQCAQAARRRGATDAVIIACLLHDIGHLMHARGEDIAEQGVDMRHEIIGEKYLQKFFPDTVSRPVGLHVEAKRYICSVEPGYLERLSDASKLSLSLQGGLMTRDECAAFEADPFHADAVLLRRCDEEGKQTDSVPPALETYFPMIRRLVCAAI